MDLKIKDVAELLNVSESTIRRWLSDKKIPSYMINQQYRFNRLEIEKWVISHKTDKNHCSSIAAQGNDLPTIQDIASPSVGGSKQYSLYRAIHKGGVFYDIHGDTKEELIRSTMKQVAHQLNFDADAISDLLLEREALQSTGLNNGIAIPHTRDFHANFNAVAIVFPKNPIPYDALDGKPVNTLFFLFANDDKHHLHLLAKIAHMSSQPKTKTLLQAKPSKDQLLEYVKEWEGRIN